MTRARKGTRKGGSSSKKESPEKSRRSTRRRGHRKSESEAEESGSDRSVDEQDVNNQIEDFESKKDEPSGSNEGAKGDESGSSDGAWQVRSENGNKGGIPKLKLCLHRPPELASPTSDPLSSPRLRKSRKAASPPPTVEENVEEVAELEAIESKEEETDKSTGRGRTRAEKKESFNEELQSKTGKEIEREQDIDEVQVGQSPEGPVEEKQNLEELKSEKDKLVQETVNQANDATTEMLAHSEETQETATEQIENTSKQDQCEDVSVSIQIDERKKRSPSRDSSEERAKEAALKSRRSRKKEGSEEGEVVESPERDLSFPHRVGGRIRTSSATQDNYSDSRNSEDASTPVVRKRRWGSSGGRAAKMPPLSISTDVLKEIIPEAKPIAMSEVHLSPNGDVGMEEGELEDSIRRESRSEEVPKMVISRRRDAPSDESEKDYEEEGVESGGEEMVKKVAPERVQEPEQVRIPDARQVDVPVRKVAVLPPDPLGSVKKQKSPSPARNPRSCVLYITNLVRPFTVVQLRDLLARTGSIVGEDGFWIDKIKSRCYVKYSNEEEAVTTRHALHGVRWPASNPKQLSVDFGSETDLKSALVEGRVPTSAKEPSLPDRIVEDRRERERKRELEKERDRETHRDRIRDRERKVVLNSKEDRDRKTDGDKDRPERTVRKVTIPVREWDLGKSERGFSPPALNNDRRFPSNRDGDGDPRKKRDKERTRRSSSDEPVRKVKRKEDAPTKLLLDDLFRKTKATPSIYWLPLTSEQIAIREEMRRKHMAEHEKRMAELRRKHDVKRRRRSGTKSRSKSPKK